MVENEVCPSCSLPVKAGQAFCANCGTKLSAKPAVEATQTAAPEVVPEAETDLEAAPELDPRLAALGFLTPDDVAPAAEPAIDFADDGRAVDAAAAAPATEFAEPAAEPAAEPTYDFAPEPAPAPAIETQAPEMAPEMAPAPPAWAPQAWPAPDPAPAAEPWAPLPASAAPEPAASPWTIQPSSASSAWTHPGEGSDSLRSVGAHPAPTTVVPAPPPAATVPPSTVWAPAPMPAPMPAASAYAPDREAYAPAYAPTQSFNPSQQPAPIPVQTTPAKPLSERLNLTTRELVTKGLLAGGAVVSLVSLFLPWTGITGIGIGTTGANPAPNQWAFAMPAGIPLLLITLLVLAGASVAVVVPLTANPQAEILLKRIERPLGLIADLILPMIVGGLFLGVALLYSELPWGYGNGIFVLVIGACLMIAGAVSALLTGPTPQAKTEE